MKVVKGKRALLLERAKQVKRDYLRREQEYGMLTMMKNIKNWEKLTKDITCQRMKEDIRAQWHNFEKVADYKDVQISLLMDWIAQADEQYRMTLSSHTEVVDHLVDFFYKSYTELYQDMADEADKLIREWYYNSENIRQRARSNEEHIGTMKYRMETLNKQDEYDRFTKHLSMVNEDSTKGKNLLHDVMESLGGRFGRFHKEMNDFTKNYFITVEKRAKEQATSQQRFDATGRNIARNVKRICTLERLFAQLVNKLNEVTELNGSKLGGLQKERDYLHRCFLTFREKLYADKINDTSKERVLIVSFNELFETLEDLARRGTIILNGVKACRKYETIEEKIMPFPSDETDPTKHKDLILFWNKIAGVSATRYALNEERMFLRQENDRLKQEIHTFCECLSCPVAPPILNRSGKIPYTEGSDMIRKVNTHNRCLKVPYTPDDDEPKIEDGDDNPK